MDVSNRDVLPIIIEYLDRPTILSLRTSSTLMKRMARNKFIELQTRRRFRNVAEDLLLKTFMIRCDLVVWSKYENTILYPQFNIEIEQESEWKIRRINYDVEFLKHFGYWYRRLVAHSKYGIEFTQLINAYGIATEHNLKGYWTIAIRNNDPKIKLFD